MEKILVRKIDDLEDFERNRILNLYYNSFENDASTKYPFAPNTTLFIYVIDKRLSGFVAVAETHDLMTWLASRNIRDTDSYGILTSKGLFVYNLCVLPEARNRGIGSMLINHVVNYAMAKKMDYLHLIVDSDNQPALHIYNRHGFRVKNISTPTNSNKVLTLVKLLKSDMETLMFWPKTLLF